MFTEELMSFLESKRNQREGEKSTKTADAEVNKNYTQPLKKVCFSNQNIGQFFVAYIVVCFIYPIFLFSSEGSVVLGKKNMAGGNCSRKYELVVHKNN